MDDGGDWFAERAVLVKKWNRRCDAMARGGVNMIEHVYRVGYVTRDKERDYDPRGNEVVCQAMAKWDRLEDLAKQIAKGNFNHAAVIKEARALST